MKEHFYKKENENGAVTIEATIALSAFLFMFMMIYSIITIARAQAHIQIAINNTAKEISQYSYLYGLSGLDSSLAGFQAKADETKVQVDSTVNKVDSLASHIGTCFDSLQTLVGDTKTTIQSGDISQISSSFGTISEDYDKLKENGAVVEADVDELKADIEAMAEDPQALLFGMARLVGSEALEVGKSRLIAEPITRALIKKHLKRYEGDTAENFCKSVGIVPDGTSYFDGIDFSNSTLFPYGSEEITIVANYKVKLLQLLPVDVELEITQSAITKGWLHGDCGASESPESARVTALTKDGGSIWNTATLDERVSLIRSMGVDDLVSDETHSFERISGETHIHAYEASSNTFVMIASANALYGLDSLDAVDKSQVKENLEGLIAQMNSTTDNRQVIKTKEIDDTTGNLVVKENNCSGDKNKKVILVIPQDVGLKEIYEDVLKGLETDVEFEFLQSYGYVFNETKAAQ